MGEVKRHYRQYFAQLPGQARLWHRIRQALPFIEQFRQYLRVQLGLDYEELRILDSLPIPVATVRSRPGRGNGFDLAEGGYWASKKLSDHGFKLGLLMTDHGLPEGYDLFSAQPHDVCLLDELLVQAQQLITFGDKGFICKTRRLRLAQTQRVYLITYR